jgi:hypothetical protein
MNLYELTSQWQEVADMMEDGDVEEQVILDTLESIEGEIEDKADGYAKVIAILNAETEALKKEADRLTARRKAIEAHIEYMKKSLESAMYATGKTKFKTQLFSFNIQKNPPSTQILDEDKIPGEFWVMQAPTINKAAIKDFLKANGDQEWAKLVSTEGLRIK